MDNNIEMQLAQKNAEIREKIRPVWALYNAAKRLIDAEYDSTSEAAREQLFVPEPPDLENLYLIDPDAWHRQRENYEMLLQPYKQAIDGCIHKKDERMEALNNALRDPIEGGKRHYKSKKNRKLKRRRYTRRR